MEVKFKYRSQYPLVVEAGYFYWVDEQEDKIYFAPTNDPDDMILLNEKFDESLLEELRNEITGIGSEVEGIEDRLSTIKDEILSQIDLTPYLTEDDLDGYVKDSDLDDYIKKGDIELEDSDYEIIAEKVKLTWKVI